MLKTLLTAVLLLPAWLCLAQEENPEWQEPSYIYRAFDPAGVTSGVLLDRAPSGASL